MAKLKAFVKYSDDDKIVPGTLLHRVKKPQGKGWVQVPFKKCCDPDDGLIPDFWRTHGDLRAFYKFDKKGISVAGSLVTRKEKPKQGDWIEVPMRSCCIYTTTTSTTTTTTSTSTTTSTTSTTTTV